ncbi:Oidioi.mRNA.OKI2018_I69.PAR.g12520.t1.cds [Oikopleura dioica]|uniref:Oidioi.mRNA.OKI2018_I69.PAR.g12520.t1.cds n=1 Tax=Oikopleura dioica TaxID=34765 RepID=A0ABN7S0Y8_OIKDI|nr:Oidioi.mRNA.OKI2018_I69.PAR.g12520.t1.cds [Oikopleura dioica]
MINPVQLSQLKNNVVYLWILKTTAALVTMIPVTAGRTAVIYAKQIIAFLPSLFMVAITVLTMLYQSWTHSLAKKKEVKITELEEKLKEEKKERKMLQRSSELLLDCVKGLQKKLDSEVICRKNFERKQLKKQEEYKHEADNHKEQLNSLKNVLKETILGMEDEIKSTNKFNSLRTSGSSGDAIRAH